MSKRTTRKSDRTAAVTLDVPLGVADDIELVLREFAEQAELDTALVVDHSGFLIAGISSIADVDVDTIGSLVAGASGAAEGLACAFGSEETEESIHIGDDQVIYLREIGERFILVGVSENDVPAGVLREESLRIKQELGDLLEKIKAIPKSLTRKPGEKSEEIGKAAPEPVSLRQQPQQEVVSEVETEYAQPREPSPRPAVRTAAIDSVPAVSAHEPGSPNGNGANGNGNGGHGNGNGNGNGNGSHGAGKESVQVPVSGKIIGTQPVAQTVPRKIAAEIPKRDPLPASVFEFDDSEDDFFEPHGTGPQPLSELDSRAETSSPVTHGKAIVENSPFEMDEDEGEPEDSTFGEIRPHSTPVHVSVPMARQREAEARKKNGHDEEAERKSGPRYSFELG